jgi:phosphatidylserine/phosphatidylglycerophosphate/cardiolipin synthase-like enzyme
MTCARRYALLAVLVLACHFIGTPARALDASNVLPATGSIEFAFSPEDDAAALVVRAIDAAKLQVLVQAFSFTHGDIADALIRALGRGVEVQVIADPSQMELIEHNVVPKLLAAGIAVATDAEHTAAHNKIVIIDPAGRSPVLITGSFNFTFAAQHRNAENLLVFRGNPELCKAYWENWKRHRKHSTALRARDGAR